MPRRGRRFRFACLMLGLLLPGPVAWAQQSRTAPATPQPPPPKDALGRDTPRGTVLGFMNAARNGRDDVAPQYLNTRLRDRAAVDLVHQLFVVLDSRLPPRLSELSERPEGSLANPLKPDQDVVGTIMTAGGPLDLVVEHVNVRGSGLVWLFSRTTLESIPDAYSEINLIPIDQFLPDSIKRRVLGVRLFAWLALALIFPASYRLWGLLGRLLRPALLWWRRRRGRTGELPANLVPGCARLLLLAVTIRWLLATVGMALPERVFWTACVTMLVIWAGTWGLLLSNGYVERYTFRRLHGAGRAEIAAMLRLARGIADGLVIAAGGLMTLYFFGVVPTAALAGLGIGGIAVALAAQKTLENVIGGLSIIADKAVRVGDFPSARRWGASITSACVRPGSARWIAPFSVSRMVRSQTSTSKRCRRATSSGFVTSSAFATRQLRPSCARSSTGFAPTCRHMPASIAANPSACDSSGLVPSRSTLKSSRTSPAVSGKSFSKRRRSYCSR